ncbi:MAG: hypothetical protein J5806_02925 [Lentisphaeria bacterium]|nr:hypothetical protein [Lentisphaeria bacterium]
MTVLTFSNLPPDVRRVKTQLLIRDCRRDVPRLFQKLPLPIGTTRRLWQNLLLLAQIFSDNYNEDSVDKFGTGEECEQYIECFRSWIGLLAACDLPIPERQITDDTRTICAELMLQRLIFMIERIKKEAITPKTETPLRDLDTFKHGLLRNLWAGVRRQEKLVGMDLTRKLEIIADIKELEYELAMLQYDTPEFADWENRYQNVLEQANCQQSVSSEAGALSDRRVEAENFSGREAAAYIRRSPWQIRTELQSMVRFENVRTPEVKTAGMAVLEYRAGLMKAAPNGNVVQMVLERKTLGISRFSPER